MEHLPGDFPGFIAALDGVVNSYSDEPRKFSASQVPSFVALAVEGFTVCFVLKERSFLSPLLLLCPKTFEALPHESLYSSSSSYLPFANSPTIIFSVVGASGVVCAAATMLVFSKQ